MSELILQLGNSANWSPLYSEETSAVVVGSNTTNYYPMPEITIPVLLHSHVAAIYATSSTALKSWKFAGLLFQRLSIGLMPSGNLDADLGEVRKIWLNRINLITFPRVTATYGLAFKPPFWIDRINLEIWEYTGTESDSTQNLIQSIQADLARIESKIDAHII